MRLLVEHISYYIIPHFVMNFIFTGYLNLLSFWSGWRGQFRNLLLKRILCQKRIIKIIIMIFLISWSRNTTVMIKRTKVKRKLPTNSEESPESPKKKKISADESLDSFKQVRLWDFFLTYYSICWGALNGTLLWTLETGTFEYERRGDFSLSPPIPTWLSANRV